MLDAVFWILLAACAFQRLIELRVSRRNREALASNGYVAEEAISSLRLMITLHVSWFIFQGIEAANPLLTLPTFLRILFVIVFLAAQLLRFWVLTSLGEHWNITVMHPKNSSSLEFISSGPYRWCRHPNYLAIILEFISLPLVGNAVCTAFIFSVLNWFILRQRIKVEEKFLFSRPGYATEMGPKGRLFPCFCSPHI